MALHYKKDKIKDLNADIYGSKILDKPVPKYRIPSDEICPEFAMSIIRDELIMDGNARQNLATFCQTYLDEEIHKLMDLCIDKNMIDKDEYPSTAEIENRCVHILANLWNSPEKNRAPGCSTTGSSEAAMLGGLAMKWRWRKRMEMSGKKIGQPNIVSGPVQVCWHKFARYFDVELREIPIEREQLGMTVDKLLENIDENTIGVVVTFGVTFTCQYEPVLEIAEALDRFEKRTGLNIPIHVDAASGGFLAPFIEPNLVWDFRIPRVHSINTSGHKFGLAPLGVGWIIWRDSQALPEELIFRVNYLGGDLPTFALNFSRPAGQIVAQYYNFLRLGREGYRKIHQNCYDIARYLAKEIAKLGDFEILFDGNSRKGIPAVSWILKKPESSKYNLFELSDRLRMRGWQVPAYTMPPNITDITVMRILIRHGFSRDMAEIFLDDMQMALKHLNQYPVSAKMHNKNIKFYHHALQSRTDSNEK